MGSRCRWIHAVARNSPRRCTAVEHEAVTAIAVMASLYRGRMGTRRRTGRALGAVATAAVVLLAGCSTTGGSGATGEPTSPSSSSEPSASPTAPPSLAAPPSVATWSVSTAAFGDGLNFDEWSDEFTVDLVLTLPDVWVVGLAEKPVRMLSALVGLDPATGAELWRQDVSTGLCSQHMVDGRIACLTSAQGTDDQNGLLGPLELVSIDASTGEAVRASSSVRDPIRIFPTAPGVLVVTPSQERVPGEGDSAPGARLSLLDWSSAHEVWGVELALLPQGELLFAHNGGEDLMQVVPGWAEVSGTVVLGSTLADGVLLVDPAAGPITVTACEHHVVFQDSLFCQVTNRKTKKTAVLRRDLAGVALWAADDLALPLATVPQGTQPVALRGTRVVDVDWETGSVGAEVLDLGDPADRQFSRGLGIAGLGGADPTFVHNDDETVAAFNGDGSLAWTKQGMPNSVRELATQGDLVVLADHDGLVMGLDRLTGAELWRMAIPKDGWVEAVPGAVIVIDDETVRRFELP